MGQSKFRQMQTYLFFGCGGWYPVECKDDEDALRHVELNGGTMRVEDMDGRLIFPTAEDLDRLRKRAKDLGLIPPVASKAAD